MKRTTKLSQKKRSMRRLFFDMVVLFIACCFIFVTLLLLWLSTITLPSFGDFEARKVAKSTKIYDRTGKVVLYNFHDNIKRTVVPFDQISTPIKQAVVAIEDDQFYEHHGIRITSILRSVFKTATGSTQGGSTITQQVVKNSLLSSEKTITRKVKEWILAIKLEQNLSKDEILGIYLNESPFGGNIYGVEEASLLYFNKHASEVTIVEAAYLAAMPQAPSRYSPYGSRTDLLEARKNRVLEKMYTLGMINKKEYTESMGTKVTFSPQENSYGKALHFVFYVRQYLEDTYGIDALENGGLKVVTTLDYELQKKQEELVKRYALENKKKYDAENAGLVAIDVKTGQILSMVGSRDYFDTEINGKYNITTAKRQPGSSFKPIVYADAFEKGYTKETVLFDVPTEFNVNCPPIVTEESAKECYHPVNYDGKYRGPISLKDALAQSLNVPAVKLLYLTGVDSALERARSMGITTLKDKNTYGLTLVLGGGEVTLLELASAYTTFASTGTHKKTTSILSVTDSSSTTLESFRDEEGETVISKNTALQISDMLSDNVARTPLYGANSLLYFKDRSVAVKTGTTNDYRDVWAVGYTPSVVIGVWGGNNDNRVIDKKTAGVVITPLWRAAMDAYFSLYPTIEFFEEPETVETANGILRGAWCSQETGVRSILYYIRKENPTVYMPGNTNDEQYYNWETAIQNNHSLICPFSSMSLPETNVQ